MNRSPALFVSRSASPLFRRALLATLSPLLLAAPSWAQLVVSDSGFIAPDPLSTLDVATGTLTPIAGWSFPLGPDAVAADEAGEVLYLVDPGGGLWRWPYSDPAPVLVGTSVPSPTTGMTFANGKLYVGFRNLCRTQVYEMDPATSNATLWFDNFTVAQYSIGLAYDPTSDSILSLYYAQGASSGGGCSTAGTGTLGVRALDPLTQTSTLLATYPGGSYPASATVGAGRLWLHSRSRSVIDNLDLTTLTWDPTPPPNPLTYGLAGLQGVTWAPGLTGNGGGGGGAWRRLMGTFQGIFSP